MEGTKVFDASWHNGNELPPALEGQDYSESVLVDPDGRRKDFYIGWYDHDCKKWMFQCEDQVQHDEHLKWQDLPFDK